MNAVERQGQLRFHEAVGDAGIVPLALHELDPVFVGLRSHMLLGGGQLNFSLLAVIITD